MGWTCRSSLWFSVLPSPSACLCFARALLPKGIPHTFPSFLSPFLLGRSSDSFMIQKANQADCCWVVGVDSVKSYLGNSWLLAKRSEPKNKSHTHTKSFLQQILFCFSAQQERLKSTATSQHVAEGRGANGVFISEWQRFVFAKCSSAGRAVKCCLLDNNSSSDS